MKKNMKISQERFMTPSLFMLAVLAVLAMTTTLAHAQSLISDDVTGAITSPSSAIQIVPSSTTVIDPGVEFVIEFFGTPVFDVDIGAVSMSVVSVFGQPFATMASEILVLGNLDASPGAWWIGGITNFQTNQGPGISIGDVTFTDREVRFNMSPNIWAADGYASWDLVFVPAPSSLALLGLGGLAAARRRRMA